jgi:NADP-dependent 3-hydroxy acid dehydrogenase YdfG
VTGASAGIGRATVATLIGHGANVIATGRRQDALEALVAEHGAGRVTAIAGDLNDGDFVADLVPAAADVDILVSNAGVLKYAPILDLTYDDMEDMVRTNVLGSFRITHEIAKAMVERGRGHIVVMTSTAAREVYPLGSIYCATKHALSAFARALRIELQAKGIQVSEIAPGMVDTDIRNNSDHPAVLAAVSARKFEPLTPEEVAEAVGFALLSSDNCANDLIELRPRGAAA